MIGDPKSFKERL